MGAGWPVGVAPIRAELEAHFIPRGSLGHAVRAPAESGACVLGPHFVLSGDCPPSGAESEALAGEVGKVDHTGSGEQVGEVAL